MRHLSKEHKMKIGIANSKALKGFKHTKATRNKMSDSRKGSKNWNWKNGTYIDKYRFITVPGHPHGKYGHYVAEHRFVVEQIIGRYLKSKEIVHHIGKITDNRPNMLMAFKSNSAHIRFHKNPFSVKKTEIIFDGRLLNHVPTTT